VFRSSHRPSTKKGPFFPDNLRGIKKLMRRVQHDGYVQFGCGLTAPESWTNFDASPTLRMQRFPVLRWLARHRALFPDNVHFGDIVRGLPIEPASCRVVYSSHVLEHLPLEDCRTALRNCWAALRPGGTFRFVLPDLESNIRRYLSSSADTAASDFVRNMWMGHESRPRGLKQFLVEWFGNKRHQWAWDFKSLAAELRAAGFVDVRRARMGDSPDPRLRDVEHPDRWNDCLGIECRRPMS
jgi:SAM-dependent methyltransferase